MKKIAVLTLLLIFLSSFAFAGTIQLPQTGQTTSYAAGDDGALQQGIASPSPRFVDNGDGTVTDTLTGFMWTKNANLPDTYKSWQQALDYVAELNAIHYLDHNDWRLPNVNELKSLTDYGKYGPILIRG